jgi:hypothetical protein
MENYVSSTKDINMLWFPLATIYLRALRFLMLASFTVNVPTRLIKYKQRRGITKPLFQPDQANS